MKELTIATGKSRTKSEVKALLKIMAFAVEWIALMSNIYEFRHGCSTYSFDTLLMLMASRDASRASE